MADAADSARSGSVRPARSTPGPQVAPRKVAPQAAMYTFRSVGAFEPSTVTAFGFLSASRPSAAMASGELFVDSHATSPLASASDTVAGLHPARPTSTPNARRHPLVPTPLRRLITRVGYNSHRS